MRKERGTDMALQMILGNSGAGKSHFIYQKIIRESMEHPDRQYVILVPEQFTMQTQKRLVQMHPGGGILNIDVLSFERLAYRVFEEVGGDDAPLLEETGKSLVLQKIVQDKKKELPYLGVQMKKPGCIQEMKSLVSELMQYDVGEETLGELVKRSEDQALLHCKLQDIHRIYEGFREYLKERFLTGEEVPDVLCRVIEKSKKFQGGIFVLDGYTGFTPIQNKLIRELMLLGEQVYVTVTMDVKAQRLSGKYQLFSMSGKMRDQLLKLAGEARVAVEKEQWVLPGENSRFGKNPELNFLEQHLFRYHRVVYEREPQALALTRWENPLQEVKGTAAEILRLVREKGYRYGEIAVITGDLPSYGTYARQVFSQAQIPYFIDEKHSILMNPFVEFLRAAVEMIVDRFSYESCFRYLRCGMSSLSLEEIDELDNYVTALGIRGYSKWKETWVRLYPGLDEERILELNRYREQFLKEISWLVQGFRGGVKTVRERSCALYQFISDNEMQEKLKIQELEFAGRKDKAMEKEYAQIYGIVMRLLDKMVEILGDEKVSAREYQQLLEAGLTEAKVALIPPSSDQVLVGDMERTRLKEIKVLFFLGVNEGNIPKDSSRGGLLTQMDREFFQEEKIELAPDARELLGQSRFYLYLNLTKPQDFLYLSYSQANAKGEGLSAAYLVGTIQKLFPALRLRCGQGSSLEGLQRPSGSLDYFLEGLQEYEYGQETKVWRELYRWYQKDESYRPQVKRLVEAFFSENPQDRISKAVAKALYGEVSPYGATRLEQYAACAFAHFLRYGLQVTERVQYEFSGMDLGNVMHKALEIFARKVRDQRLSWGELSREDRERLVSESLQEVTEDYGNTILHSCARNEYLIRRTQRVLNRTAWALQEQLRRGDFQPEGFEVAFEGGRIDRVDICEDENKVYVKVMDYKTGNVSFDLVALYHGLQLQLMVYLDAALLVEQKKYPDREVIPAAIFYYNIKDPMIKASIEEDIGKVEQKILRELKVNGLVQSDPRGIEHLDVTMETLPLTKNKDGSFRKGSSVASLHQFGLLSDYVKGKIQNLRREILEGNAQAAPYQMDKKEACTYCPYRGICGFDQKIPGFFYRRLKNLEEKEVWEKLEEEVKSWV
ncbi:ATP-dependent helicase/deoxyribonuclease subunit B [Blautia hydrogenotrophica]|nr:ATP-dependent helicase/deoxyribonuclease subunit B [Blautia hydrogenotrophica]SCH67309.1 ATP-dependent helicase/deoxyribonuclease subunit B [uncultured Blautia sp.]